MPAERLRRSGGSAAGWAAGAATFSRLAMLVLAFLAPLWIATPRVYHALRDPQFAEVLHGTLGRLFEPWTHWDGVWFIRIASAGYTHADSQAFLPLYPLLVHGVGVLTGGDYVIAGVIVSLLSYAGAMALLYRLVAGDLGAKPALWTVVFLSFFPTAFFFQAIYSESLFLLLSVACFLAARRGRWALAGLAGLLASLTRNTGLLLALPLAWMWWEQRRGASWRLPGSRQVPAAPRTSRPRAAAAPLLASRPPWWSFGWLAAVPAGLGIYVAYLNARFGDWLLFNTAQRHWGRAFAWPMTTIGRGYTAAVKGLKALFAFGIVNPAITAKIEPRDLLSLSNVTAFAALLLAAALLVLCWRLLPAPYTIYGLATLLVPLFYPTPLRPLMSLPRLILVDFPLFVALAAGLARRPVARGLVLAVFAAGLVMMTALYATWYFVA